MHRNPLAGLKASRHVLSKTVASCLAETELPYNWASKVRGVVLGICLARSTVLQDIARALGGKVKPREKDLSELLSRKRLGLEDGARRAAIRTLRRIGKRKFFRYRGKLVLVVDTTSYVKLRSRGKEQRMPKIGKVRPNNIPSSETILAPGYNDLWTGLMLKDKTCLGITRRLFTELTALPSQNALEEAEILRAIDLVQEAFGMSVILVADRGFRRKELLAWLRKDLGIDFVIRIAGKLTVKARGWEGLLHELTPHWPERLRRFWRDDSKDPILSQVRSTAVSVALSKQTRLAFSVVCLTPIERKIDPMFLATTLPIGTVKELSMIVTLYSKRWGVETFNDNWKWSLGAAKFRVFSSWGAIDRLLTLAHLAFLVLYLMLVLSRDAVRGTWRGLWVRVQEQLHDWFARPPEFTLGNFFESLAIDFRLSGSRRTAG